MINKILKSLMYTLIVPTFMVILVVTLGCITFDIPLTLVNFLEVLSRSLPWICVLYISTFYVFYGITKGKELN